MNGSHHRSLLTNREREIFALLLAEKTTRDIAEQLGISEKNSAKSHFQYNSKARCNESISGVN